MRHITILVVFVLAGCSGGGDDAATSDPDAGDRPQAGSSSKPSNAEEPLVFWDCSCTVVDGIEERTFDVADGNTNCGEASLSPTDVVKFVTMECHKQNRECSCECKVSKRQCECPEVIGACHAKD